VTTTRKLLPLRVEADPDDHTTMVLSANGLPFCLCYSLVDARLVVKTFNDAQPGTEDGGAGKCLATKSSVATPSQMLADYLTLDRIAMSLDANVGGLERNHAGALADDVRGILDWLWSKLTTAEREQVNARVF
jgi:hypothetical protein